MNFSGLAAHKKDDDYERAAHDEIDGDEDEYEVDREQVENDLEDVEEKDIKNSPCKIFLSIFLKKRLKYKAGFILCIYK